MINARGGSIYVEIVEKRKIISYTSFEELQTNEWALRPSELSNLSQQVRHKNRTRKPTM